MRIDTSEANEGVSELWYDNLCRYDGYPPHAADDYKERISLSGQSSLNLTTVRESDKGWYECKVFFLNRETIRNGTWIYLDVLGMCLYHDDVLLKPS